jgi:hypothetical protein
MLFAGIASLTNAMQQPVASDLRNHNRTKKIKLP